MSLMDKLLSSIYIPLRVAYDMLLLNRVFEICIKKEIEYCRKKNLCFTSKKWGNDRLASIIVLISLDS